MGHSSLIIYANYTEHTSGNHTCILEENFTPIMCILSIHGKLHLYKYANHLSSKVQNFPPPITTQHDMHFHQQAITQLARNPLHHQTQINSIAPMNNKPSKAYTLQVNKNNQMQKKTKEFGLSMSTTLHDAQPSCSLSYFAIHQQHFRVFTFHPSTKGHLTLFQHYNGTCMLEIFKTCIHVEGKLIIKI